MQIGPVHSLLPTQPSAAMPLQLGATGSNVEPDYPPGHKPTAKKSPDETVRHLSDEKRKKKIEMKLTFEKPVLVVQHRKASFIPADEIYEMDRLPHGVCVIINNKKFGIYKEDRLGTERDEENLQITFQYLGYDVEIYRDCKAGEMKAIFKALQGRDFSKDDSFVCCILSHGEDRKILGTDGHKVDLDDDIVSRFQANSCPGLAGKPKMFFIQACRGVVPKKAVAQGDSGYVVSDGPTVTRPKMADFFFGFASSPGYKALRDTKEGSWYIAELCEVFCSRATFTELHKMHTLVTDNVNKKESVSERGELQKEAPSVETHGWAKELYFF